MILPLKPLIRIKNVVKRGEPSKGLKSNLKRTEKGLKKYLNGERHKMSQEQLIIAKRPPTN